jgi:membrane protein YqaA with SNARE-associated domain
VIRLLLILVLLASAPIGLATAGAESAFGKIAVAAPKTTAPAPAGRRRSTSVLGHLGGLGLFFVAMLDSSPIPTFGGLDILTAVLAGRHAEPWFYYAAIATAGSVIGAYMTFKGARKAGAAYLERKFGKRKVTKLLEQFQHWGTGGLIVSTAVPFPFPTSFFFAAAGVLKYSFGKFIVVVAVCRGVRYATVALVASLYGRHFIRVLRNPGQYYEWLLGIGIALVCGILITVLLRKRFQAAA